MAGTTMGEALQFPISYVSLFFLDSFAFHFTSFLFCFVFLDSSIFSNWFVVIIILMLVMAIMKLMLVIFFYRICKLLVMILMFVMTIMILMLVVAIIIFFLHDMYILSNDIDVGVKFG